MFNGLIDDFLMLQFKLINMPTAHGNKFFKVLSDSWGIKES